MSSTELSLVIPADKRLRKNTPILLTLPAACASNHWAVEYRNGQFLPLQQINRDQFATIAPDFEFNCEVEGKLVRLEQAPPDEVRLVPNPEMFGLDIYLGEVLLTRYVYESVPARPYFYPLFAPQGIPITRNYPMVPDVPGEITDHPHHRSLWIAHGEVNGADNWSEGGNHAKTNHLEFLSLESGTVFGRFVSKSVWATHDDIPLLEQTLETIAWNIDTDVRMIDFKISLEAMAESVLMGDTKEGGILSLRVATALDGKHGGQITNAYGGVGEAETWGKAANWCDYSGTMGYQPVGVAIFDHPYSFRYPTHWHVRDYGLMTANPFGYSYFTNNKKNGDHTLRQGEKLEFSYRMVLHLGDCETGNISQHYLNFVNPPSLSIETR